MSEYTFREAVARLATEPELVDRLAKDPAGLAAQLGLTGDELARLKDATAEVDDDLPELVWPGSADSEDVGKPGDVTGDGPPVDGTTEILCNNVTPAELQCNGLDFTEMQCNATQPDVIWEEPTFAETSYDTQPVEIQCNAIGSGPDAAADLPFDG
jgi:hypothetical protein